MCGFKYAVGPMVAPPYVGTPPHACTSDDGGNQPQSDAVRTPTPGPGRGAPHAPLRLWSRRLDGRQEPHARSTLRVTRVSSDNGFAALCRPRRSGDLGMVVLGEQVVEGFGE